MIMPIMGIGRVPVASGRRSPAENSRSNGRLAAARLDIAETIDEPATGVMQLDRIERSVTTAAVPLPLAGRRPRLR